MTELTHSLKQMLENKRAELVRGIRAQSSQLSVSEAESDLIDRMQSMCSRDQAVTLLGTLGRTLEQIDAALDAMRRGTYGICSECEEPIPVKRLRTIPWASHCIRCQEMLERNEVHDAAPVWDEAA